MTRLSVAVTGAREAAETFKKSLQTSMSRPTLADERHFTWALATACERLHALLEADVVKLGWVETNSVLCAEDAAEAAKDADASLTLAVRRAGVFDRTAGGLVTAAHRMVDRFTAIPTVTALGLSGREREECRTQVRLLVRELQDVAEVMLGRALMWEEPGSGLEGLLHRHAVSATEALKDTGRFLTRTHRALMGSES